MKPDGRVLDGAMRSRMVVGHATKAALTPCIEAHYLHRWPAVVPCRLALWLDGVVVGACVFAFPPRETVKRYKGMVWELARLWLAPECPRNSETFFVARALRHVRRTHPGLVGVVSYADPSVGHTGLIYRAGNWRSDGRTDADRRTPRFDYVVAGKRYSRRAHCPAGVITRVPRTSKYRFFYPLVRALVNGVLRP